MAKLADAPGRVSRQAMTRTSSILANMWLKDHVGLVTSSPLTYGFKSHREFNFNFPIATDKAWAVKWQQSSGWVARG